MINLIKKNFDKAAFSYDENSLIQKKTAIKLIEMLSSFLKSNQSQSNFVALDIGCGTGEFSKLMNNNFNLKKLHMIDFSKNMISLAKKKNITSEVSFEVSDFDEFNFYSKFNLIFSNMSVHWSKNFKKLFEKILFQVNKDSIILISYVNSSSFSFFKKNKDFDYRNINNFPNNMELINLLNKNKFLVTNKEVILEKEYEGPLHFFSDLKKIGANTKTNKKKFQGLFKLRKKYKKILINFNMSCYLIKERK